MDAKRLRELAVESAMKQGPADADALLVKSKAIVANVQAWIDRGDATPPTPPPPATPNPPEPGK